MRDLRRDLHRDLHVVLPNDIDDPSTPSGGNVYDRRACRGLAALGWAVREYAVAGAWPHPDSTARARLATVLAEIPDGALVLIDGLVGATVPEVLTAAAARLRLVILAHMPFGEGSFGEDADRLARAEGEALAAANGVVTTSRWCRNRLIDMYGLPDNRVHVAPPGVDRAPLAAPSDSGGRLLCVAAITPHKGHHILLDALASTCDLPWQCVCVGSLERDPGFVTELRRRVDSAGLAGRITFTGPRVGHDLAARYAAADLLVLPSLGESFGMVVIEALARGIPVLATDAKGLPEAMGSALVGDRADRPVRPGILVPPSDGPALAYALRRWLSEPELRGDLRAAAVARRATLPGWDHTARLLHGALDQISSTVGAGR